MNIKEFINEVTEVLKDPKSGFIESGIYEKYGTLFKFNIESEHLTKTHSAYFWNHPKKPLSEDVGEWMREELEKDFQNAMKIFMSSAQKMANDLAQEMYAEDYSELEPGEIKSYFKKFYNDAQKKLKEKKMLMMLNYYQN